MAERWLAAQRAYDRVPGLSAAIVHDQELLWSGASGYADLASRRQAQADTGQPPGIPRPGAAAS